MEEIYNQRVEWFYANDLIESLLRRSCGGLV